MKKIFTLSLLFMLLGLGGANAQVKKTWDFQNVGFSDETVANLDADEANWEKEGVKDGKTTGWKEAKKHTGVFMANNQVIPEMLGLELVNSGLSNNNNVIIRPDRVRINRNNMKLKLPKLVNGQVITINCQSANGTATDRGIKASFDYMKRVEGPEDNLILGTAGIVTNKWEVQTTETDSVDIEFTFITGGLDIRLIMIDNGDELKATSITYLSDGNDDQVLSYLNTNELYTVTAIDVTTETITEEALRESEVTIVGGSVPADNAAVAVVKEAMPWTPILNLNASLYPVWGYGEAVETGAPFVAVKDKNNALFKGVELTEDEGLVFYEVTEESPLLAVQLGDYFTGDKVLGVAVGDDGTADNSLVTIHTHNITHNGYIYLPYGASDLMDEAMVVIDNAIVTLQNSKATITPATVPNISIEYKDLKTNVTITAPALAKVRVFYTTDGTEPTTESTEYTGMFTLTEESTVKAAAIAEGYTLSKVVEKLVDIRQQPKTPVITWTEEGAQTTIKITGEGYDENVKLYYNFSDELTTDTLKSTLYADSIPVVITMPQNVTAFAVADGAVWSEVAQQRVLVKNPRIVIDVVAHYSAPQWTGDNNPAGLKVDNGKGMFSWGASAATMYIGEGTPGYDPETGDETIIYGDEDLRPYEVVNEPGENPEWVLKSRGTCLIWQNTGAQTTNFGDDSNYNPMYSTDVDPLFPVTKNDIQFYKFQGGETPNASIETLKKYQAPLDIVVLANMAGGPLVAQVSEDGEKWETVGEIAKTGKSRMWSKYTLSYDGTNEVFVRVTEEVASAGPKVFDIYVAIQGEKSQELLKELEEEYLTGIQDIENTPKAAAAGIYNLNGIRQQSLKRGLNIVVSSDGTVKKVLVK